MERPTPLLPAVTAPIDLQPYKDPGKGNLAGDEKGEPGLRQTSLTQRQKEKTQRRELLFN